MIHGKKDMIITWDSVKHMEQIFKNACNMDNNGHMIPIECPEKYEKLISDFIIA